MAKISLPGNSFSDEDLLRILPQYLSEPDMVALRADLKAFAEGKSSGTWFTSRLANEPYLLQGDIIKAPVNNFPIDGNVSDQYCLIVSNTCDISLDNKRINSARIMYVPLLNYDKYSEMAISNYPTKAQNHLMDLRLQQVSQALFVPSRSVLGFNSLAFFDRAMSVPLNDDFTKKFLNSRRSTLSDFGFYMLLLKLSMHFCRVQERVERRV